MRTAMVVAVIYLTVAWGLTPPQSEGELLYDGACATCHDAPAANSRAPQKDALRQRSPEAIVDALTGGAMRYQGLSLSGLFTRAALNAALGGVLFFYVDRHLARRRRS